MPTDLVNASETDAQAQQSTSESSDDITSHPQYKELEEKHSAARKGMDESNLTKKQLAAELAKYKLLAGEEAPEKKSEPTFVTTEQLEAKAWEIANAKDLEVYGDEEYRSDIASGIPAKKALQYAKLRFQTNPDSAKINRQQSISSGGTTSTRNLENIDITDADRKNQAIWGYSDAAILKQKEMKKARGS